MKSDVELEDLMLKMQQLEEDKENEEIERCIATDYTPISEEKQLEYERMWHARRRENAKNGVSWRHHRFMNAVKPEVDALHRWGEDILAKTLL